MGKLTARASILGVKVELIDPVGDLDDMVFTANQMFVGCHDGIGSFTVPSRMRALPRARDEGLQFMGQTALQ
jgi:N-dimethylarginine dimethylaminohydrolase